ncbi:MAG TPA: adenosylmethionine decarboxylase [Dehalococcoidia bacterium]|nr:adenosylmethionine decarboxylase [Dehalococcoidia bacterium]
MHALGRHLLLELKICNEEALDDLNFIKDCLNEAAIESGATVVGESFYHFSPYGVSGVVNIAESHIAIHTWPEYRYAALDVFTCGNDVDPEKAARLITERLGAKSHSLIELRRGIVEDSHVGCAK